MESAESLALDLQLRNSGIQVLQWENKSDLVQALVILQAALQDFSQEPILLPTDKNGLQQMSLALSESSTGERPTRRRFFLIPQGSSEIIGSWMNGWRSQLAEPPGTVLIIRHADFVSLLRRSPDLMSFAQSETHDATNLLPLVSAAILEKITLRLSSKWVECLGTLPGVMPSEKELTIWLQQLKQNVD